MTADQALYNFDLIKFYHNFLNAIVDNQLDDGQVPNYVPANKSPYFPDWGSVFPPDTNWGTALPTITWLVYRHYNDVHTLDMYYNHVVAYVNYFHGIYNQTGLANFTERFGDWVPPPPQPMTNRHLIASFAFLHDVHLVVNMSRILGKRQDADMYSTLYEQLAEEFHRVFFNTSLNYYADGMQAAQALALALPGVVPEKVKSEVIKQLTNDIIEKNNHVSTGIVSTAQIYPVLSDNGHHDLAVELISSITYPSYGYMFNNPYENATTMWELWNTATGEPMMDSRNQAMFTSVGAWFYSHLAGIDLSTNVITIRPRMASEAKKHLMSKLHCQLNTLYGLVHVSYTRDERDTIANSILLRVTVPPNTFARVIFEPLFVGAQCKTLMEDNQVIWSSNVNATTPPEFDITKDSTSGLMTVHTGSGEYVFQALWE